MAHTNLKTRTAWDLLLLAMDVAEAAILLVEITALLEVATVLVVRLVQAREVATVPALAPAEAVLKVCEALHLLVGTVHKAEVWVLVPVLVAVALCLVR